MISFGGEAVENVSDIELDIPAGEWEKSQLLAYEREMLGLYVSDHPLLGIEHILRMATDVSISQLLDDVSSQDRMVTIGGLVTSIQRKVTRQGASWAIVTIEDLEGSIEALFFAKTYTQYALTLTEDRIVVIRGRADRREDQLRFTALEMSFPEISQGAMGPFVIKMPIVQCTPPVVDRLKEILRTHPGAREVHLQLDDHGKSTILKLEAKVTASPSLSADLKAILGPDCLL